MPSGKNKPHLLYVAWGFPPSRAAGVYRALATANAFARAGWDVTVLTANREVFEYQTGTDVALERKVDRHVNIVRVPFSGGTGEPDLSNWSRARVTSNLLWTYLRAQKDRITYPEPVYGGWRKNLEAATEQVHRDRPVHLVLGTANPQVDFAPGWYLHKTAGVPYVMDYRDSWHLDVYADKRTSPRWSRSVRKERKLLAHATEAWFVNAPIRDWHAREYPQNQGAFRIVANAFEEDFAAQFAGIEPRAAREDGLVFGYLGTIYGPMPLRETLEGWRLARTQSALVANARFVIRGRLGHYSQPDAKILSLLDEFKDDAVTYEGPVSKVDVAATYREFDALLLILGKSKYVTSGKVFEYAATGLPIASIHHPDTAASSVLQGRDDWFPLVEVTAVDAARVLREAAESAVSRTADDLKRNQLWARHLSRDVQFAPRIESLAGLVAAESGD